MSEDCKGDIFQAGKNMCWRWSDAGKAESKKDHYRVKWIFRTNKAMSLGREFNVWLHWVNCGRFSNWQRNWHYYSWWGISDAALFASAINTPPFNLLSSHSAVCSFFFWSSSGINGWSLGDFRQFPAQARQSCSTLHEQFFRWRTTLRCSSLRFSAPFFKQLAGQPHSCLQIPWECDMMQMQHLL